MLFVGQLNKKIRQLPSSVVDFVIEYKMHMIIYDKGSLADLRDFNSAFMESFM